MFQVGDKVRVRPSKIDGFTAEWRARFRRKSVVGTVIALESYGTIRVHWQGVKKQKFPHEWRINMRPGDLYFAEPPQ